MEEHTSVEEPFGAHPRTTTTCGPLKRGAFSCAGGGERFVAYDLVVVDELLQPGMHHLRMHQMMHHWQDLVSSRL